MAERTLHDEGIDAAARVLDSTSPAHPFDEGAVRDAAERAVAAYLRVVGLRNPDSSAIVWSCTRRAGGHDA